MTWPCFKPRLCPSSCQIPAIFLKAAEHRRRVTACVEPCVTLRIRSRKWSGSIVRQFRRVRFGSAGAGYVEPGVLGVVTCIVSCIINFIGVTEPKCCAGICRLGEGQVGKT